MIESAPQSAPRRPLYTAIINNGRQKKYMFSYLYAGAIRRDVANYRRISAIPKYLLPRIRLLTAIALNGPSRLFLAAYEKALDGSKRLPRERC